MSDRKIRCCGGAPCRNCQRAQRECDYAPVPEEVNRATREKKAQSKARAPSSASPAAQPSVHVPHAPESFPPAQETYPVAPMYQHVPFFTAEYPQTPIRVMPSHRRSVSVPNFESMPWVSPAAPVMHSPAMFENGQWMYTGWSGEPAITPELPSVMQPYSNPTTPPTSSCGSSEVDSSWSTPSYNLSVPQLSVPQIKYESPATPVYYSPHPTPPTYNIPATISYPVYTQPYTQVPQHVYTNTSPTLAPPLQLPTKSLVGLGIGYDSNAHIEQMPSEMLTPMYTPEEYLMAPHFV